MVMTSPEGYYEFYIKGKSAEEIAKEIRELKREIRHLKYLIKNPPMENGCFIITSPSEEMRLWWNRLVLEYAITAYEETGETYKPSKAEKRAREFDAAIPAITKITFTVNDETRIITLTDDKVELSGDPPVILKTKKFAMEKDSPMTKEEFLEELREIHIGEWKRHYKGSDQDSSDSDKTKWSLTIEHSDGQKNEYDGIGETPVGFYDFCRLIENR